MDDSCGIAPEGWHVPSDDEWKQLEMYLGMSQADADTTGLRGVDEGGKLKEAGTTHWNPPNEGATNESGFTALPAGYRYYNGTFDHMGDLGLFWCSPAIGSYYAWSRFLYFNHSEVNRNDYYRRYGFSVRCARD